MPIQTPLPAPFPGRPLQIPGKSASRSNVSMSMNGFMNPGAALADIARAVKVGDGLDPETELGPIQNKMQYERVIEILEGTKQTAARILAGGHVLNRPGYFIAPTIVAEGQDGTRLVDEEPFGPILPILRV